MEIKEACKNAFNEMVEISKYYEKRIKCPFEDLGCKFSHETFEKSVFKSKDDIEDTSKCVEDDRNDSGNDISLDSAESDKSDSSFLTSTTKFTKSCKECVNRTQCVDCIVNNFLGGSVSGRKKLFENG